jgi:hypothetical protein
VGEGAGGAGDELRGVGCKVVKVRRGQTLDSGRLKAKVLSSTSLSGDANKGQRRAPIDGAQALPVHRRSHGT